MAAAKTNFLHLPFSIMNFFFRENVWVPFVPGTRERSRVGLFDWYRSALAGYSFWKFFQ
jgi:hypothetical protein